MHNAFSTNICSHPWYVCAFCSTMHYKGYPTETPGLEAPQTTKRYIPVSPLSTPGSTASIPYSYSMAYKESQSGQIKTFSVLDQLKGRKTAEQKELYDLLSAYTPKDVNSIMKQIVRHLEYTLARTVHNVNSFAAYKATAYSLRDRMIEHWNDTQMYYTDHDVKRVYYLSIEYLMGRTLNNAISNLGLREEYSKAVSRLGYRLEDLFEEEQDAALGNGGLGRLAACFLDSLATLNYPAWGYGIRYLYGMFKQNIVHHAQVETPDFWLDKGNPWEICRRDICFEVNFGGHVTKVVAARREGEEEKVKYRWEGAHPVIAIAYDTPIPGFHTINTNNLRLWSSSPSTQFDLEHFNNEDDHNYWSVLAERQKDEGICKVLYPNANTPKGQELRLKQEYFFSSASIQDIVRRFKKTSRPWEDFPKTACIQLNDTHPNIAIAELMHVFVDKEGLDWDAAWGLVTQTFSFTNHTVLPEALETWPVDMMAHLLPRHMQIIYEINARFLESLAGKGLSGDEVARLSIIEEGAQKRVRMANLAIIGSHKVNGVAKIHTEIIKTDVFGHFFKIWPEKFINITNGVTPRRWLRQCNPTLSNVITNVIGNQSWMVDLTQLQVLRKHISPSFLEQLANAKHENKLRLAALIKKTYPDVEVDPDAMFDVQVKRIHEYKRQLLNVLGIIHRYLWIKGLSDAERKDVVPKVCIIAGKAAPGYYAAKQIIKFVNHVAEVINNDRGIGNLLKVVFLPNYGVSMAEIIIPGNDISQHISTAGTEASGTSNMKFVLNGGLLVGTYDGANIEIVEHIGIENAFIFGARTEEVAALRKSGPTMIDERLYDVISAVREGKFGPQEQVAQLVEPLASGNDWYCLAHDFPLYIDCMEEVDNAWKDKQGWLERVAKSVSGMGFFSSDRSIREYVDNIWHVKACKL